MRLDALAAVLRYERDRALALGLERYDSSFMTDVLCGFVRMGWPWYSRHYMHTEPSHCSPLARVRDR